MSQKIERVNKLLAMCVVLNRNSWRNMLQLIVYSLSKYSIIYSTCYYQSNQSLDTENQYWMPMIFGPLSSTALKTGMIMSWKSLPGLRKTSRSHCLWTQFTVPSIKAMVEGLSCKDKAICILCVNKGQKLQTKYSCCFVATMCIWWMWNRSSMSKFVLGQLSKSI